MQLAREALALFFLRTNELVRETPQFFFGLLRPSVLLFGAPFEHADANHRDDGDRQAQCHACQECPGEVLVKLPLTLGGRLLLRVQGTVVNRLDLCRELHDGITPRDNLAPQKAVTVDLGRIVEERRVRTPILVELAPQLAVLPEVGFAQQRFQLRRQLLALRVVGQKPRAVFGGRSHRVEQVVARENA
jgi:hypothetical protein